MAERVDERFSVKPRFVERDFRESEMVRKRLRSAKVAIQTPDYEP
jgi:hypothetical protein